MLGGCSDTPGRVGAALRVWDACRGAGAGVCSASANAPLHRAMIAARIATMTQSDAGKAYGKGKDDSSGKFAEAKVS